ncbi:hypothetical protein Dda_7413 [Drechslerella dactyloides]|uniref:Uncharacterized protein n=1 Tax=Drechslerella dactyloides TaxID=74499 RepID=A0AAD6IVN0_DREDA|nr:hypothetical protein Dda_7413 [Drechslerella dactyloides]
MVDFEYRQKPSVPDNVGETIPIHRDRAKGCGGLTESERFAAIASAARAQAEAELVARGGAVDSQTSPRPEQNRNGESILENVSEAIDSITPEGLSEVELARRLRQEAAERRAGGVHSLENVGAGEQERDGGNRETGERQNAQMGAMRPPSPYVESISDVDVQEPAQAISPVQRQTQIGQGRAERVGPRASQSASGTSATRASTRAGSPVSESSNVLRATGSANPAGMPTRNASAPIESDRNESREQPTNSPGGRPRSPMLLDSDSAPDSAPESPQTSGSRMSVDPPNEVNGIELNVDQPTYIGWCGGGRNKRQFFVVNAHHDNEQYVIRRSSGNEDPRLKIDMDIEQDGFARDRDGVLRCWSDVDFQGAASIPHGQNCHLYYLISWDGSPHDRYAFTLDKLTKLREVPGHRKKVTKGAVLDIIKRWARTTNRVQGFDPDLFIPYQILQIYEQRREMAMHVARGPLIGRNLRLHTSGSEHANRMVVNMPIGANARSRNLEVLNTGNASSPAVSGEHAQAMFSNTRDPNGFVTRDDMEGMFANIRNDLSTLLSQFIHNLPPIMVCLHALSLPLGLPLGLLRVPSLPLRSPHLSPHALSLRLLLDH